MLSEESRASLGMMAAAYRAALAASPQALSYLSGRGIGQAAIERFQLGLVDGSFAENAIYSGRICIPYLTKLGGICSLKFRVAHDCDDTHDHQKYITPYPTRIFNPFAFERAEQLGYIGISEGEFDAVINTVECDIPTIGIPGVDTWVKHPEWRPLFDGYAKVLVFKDQDDAGEKLAKRISHDLENAVEVNLPANDVNATFLKHGADAIREAAGL
jgi:DNA primase